jgi:hypothetical protein
VRHHFPTGPRVPRQSLLGRQRLVVADSAVAAARVAEEGGTGALCTTEDGE